MYNLLWLNFHLFNFWVLEFCSACLGPFNYREISVKPTVFREIFLNCILFIYPFAAVFTFKIRQTHWVLTWRKGIPNIFQIGFGEPATQNILWRFVELFLSQSFSILVRNKTLKSLWGAFELMFQFLDILFDMLNFPIILSKCAYKVIFQ